MDFINVLKTSWSFSLYREIHIYFDERKRFFKEAKQRFDKEKPENGSWKDYKEAFRKHRVTYSEYMYSYEYWKRTEKERDEFISTSEMQCIYRKLGDKTVRTVFHDKTRFLTLFKNYIYRKWSMAKDLTFDEFKSMIEEHDCIAKPIDGTRGNGIFKICANDVDDWRLLYSKCKDENILIEECIEECDELASFHSSSLNTIRVVTVSGKDKCVVFGALFRMGAHGSIIDNTHAGGIYVPINIETGTIDIDAIDSQNNRYGYHPDTHKQIRGFKIPYWQDIVRTCKDATQTIPNIHFAGWDLCVTKDGKVEIIEGNHAPDFDGGMQAPLKIGVKYKLSKVVKDVMGINPLQYIAITS